MTTLFDVIRKTYLKLGHLEVSTATGGSTSTVIDTKLGEKYGDDDIIGSSILIIRDSAGAGAAPEKEISTVTAYTSSTFTINISPNLTTAVAVGDKYGIAKNIIDVNTLVELINDALQALGTIQLADTSITTVDGTTEYSLPIGIKHRITSVQLQTNEETGDNRWREIPNYYVVNSVPGTTGLIVFTESLPGGYTLKIFYQSEHPVLSAYDDEVSETLHSEYVATLASERAYEYQTRRTNGTDPFLLQTANKAMQDSLEARVKYSQPTHKKPKYLTPHKQKNYKYIEDGDD